MSFPPEAKYTVQNTGVQDQSLGGNLMVVHHVNKAYDLTLFNTFHICGQVCFIVK